MVSSTASPMAILAIRLVTMESSMPNHPMTPKLITIGKILGTTAISPTLTDKNSANMMPKTKTIVIERLLICPAVKSSLLAEIAIPRPVTSHTRSFEKSFLTCADIWSRTRTKSLELDMWVSSRIFVFEKSGLIKRVSMSSPSMVGKLLMAILTSNPSCGRT